MDKHKTNILYRFQAQKVSPDNSSIVLPEKEPIEEINLINITNSDMTILPTLS